MNNWNSADEVIKFAIGEEQAAYEFYLSLSKKSKDKVMQIVFMQFAGEEMGHRKKLEAVKSGSDFFVSEGDIKNLKISDYLIDIDPDSVDTYQDALLLAAKKEKAAFRLYSNLSEMVSSRNLKELFKSLAQEEARHKLRFEIEYDDLIREN